MSTSIPTDSILNFIKNNEPDIVLVSITLEENLLAGQRLVKKIKEKNKIPILVGGYALQSQKNPKFEGKIIIDNGLEEIPKIIRTA